MKAAFGRLFYAHFPDPMHTRIHSRFRWPLAGGTAWGVPALTVVLALSGCALQPPSPEVTGSPWARQSAPAPGGAARWTHHRFPGKAASDFRYVRKDGRDAIAVQAQSSASMLRLPVLVSSAEMGRLRFSWKVPALMARADLGRRDAADSSVRVILAFEGDRSRFSARDAALAELARAVTGEPMPYATLMYVWCNRRPVGTIIRNSRTDRIRKLVVESGENGLNRWLEYERDIRADYERVFGEKPGALVGIAIMTDSDNTRSTTQAWYGPVRLLPGDAAGH